MRNNQKYWENRAIDRINRFTADAENVADELGKAYLMAAQQLKSDVAKVFKGFENAFGLSQKEAKALIAGSSGELPSKDIIKAIESIADKDKQREMKATVSAPAYQFRMKRLDRTAENAKRICKNLSALETRTDTAFLRAEMDKAYKNIIFDIQQGTGISGAFSQIPKSRIEQVLKENWSGRHYSTRIWNNTEKLADEVKQSLIESFMTGAGEREAAAAIQEKFSVGENRARALIRTENTYVTGQAELEGYKTARIDEYEYAAIIDGRTSELCKELDGKTFKIAEAQAGKNYPPMHTYCRSSSMAKLPSEEELEQAFDEFRVDNIPEGMEFEEWLDNLEPTDDGKLVFRDKRVDKSGKSGIIKEYSKKPITVITDKSVNNVSKVKIPGYADEECDFIYRQHKELLEYSRENNKSYETAFVFEKLFKPRKPYIGTDDSLDFGEPLYGTDLFVMHNHPRNNSFSLNDIIFFWSNSNVKTLTIVKNSGDVEYITKSSNYNSSVLKLEYDRLYKDIIVNNTDFEKNKLIKKLLTKTRSGVIWSGR